MSRLSRWTPMALLLLLAATAASAQTDSQPTNERRGFWIGFGLGFGNLGCGDCANEPGGGFSGHLKLGGTPSRKVLVGFETMFWVKEDEDIDATLSWTKPA